MNEICWDDTIELSNKKYLSSEISTIEKEIYINGELKELTAKEWIIYEIEKCKRELQKNENEISSKKEIEKDIRELKLLNQYFEKHITNIDIWGIHLIDNEDYNKSLDNNYNDIKEIIKTKQKRKEEKLNNIKKQQTDIIRICLENIKLILQKENVKKYFDTADTLLKKNDIILGKNNKQTIYMTDESYTQNNIELYLKKLTK